MNREVSTLLETAEMQFEEFSSVMYVLKQVYGRSDFGERTIENPENPPDRIEEIVDWYSVIIRHIRDVKHDFTLCIGRPERHLNWDGDQFVEDYEYRRTEYYLCFERCIRSVVGGRQKAREDFEFVADNLRLGTKTGPSEIETLRDFADCWYQIIMALKFMATAEELAADVYSTDMPDSIDVFQIEDFIDELTALVSEKEEALVRERSALYELHPDWVEQAGKTVFGTKWPVIRERLVFSEETLEAHPFVFYLEYVERRETPGLMTPVQTPRAGVIFSSNLANILKLQLFPLLQNGEEKRSHDLLADLTADRGTTYEQNIYEYLSGAGFECYHGAEITRKNKNEIDLILDYKEKLWFIEVKFFMPTTAILTRSGIEEINEKFNFKIFKEDTEKRRSTPSGKPFTEKVENWTELEPRSTFTSLVGSEDPKRVKQEIGENWKDRDVEMLVVSNLVPSYAEKEGVRFLTDVEFYKLIERDEKVFPETQESAL